MIKKTIEYTDYNGNLCTEEAFFHLTKAELIELELSEKDGFQEHIKKLTEEQNTKEIYKIFKEILTSAYGIKSEDGKRFIKDPQLTKEFTQTEAFSELIFSLISDAEGAAAFIAGIGPKMDNTTKPVAMGA